MRVLRYQNRRTLFGEGLQRNDLQKVLHMLVAANGTSNLLLSTLQVRMQVTYLSTSYSQNFPDLFRPRIRRMSFQYFGL